MDDMNGVIPERRTQETELQPTIPNAPSTETVSQPVEAATNASIPQQDPIQEPIVNLDPTDELGQPPAQAPESILEQPIPVTIVNPAPLPQVLEEQLAQQPTLTQEQRQGAASRPIPLNRPLQDLFQDDRRQDFFNICVPMYEASMKGDWNAACNILKRFARPNHDQDQSYLLRFSITDNSETALHIAASTQNADFVRNLVGLMQIEDLRLQNNNGNTALCLAAMAGNVEIAKIMVNHNPNQNQTQNHDTSCSCDDVCRCWMAPMLSLKRFGGDIFRRRVSSPNQDQNQNQNQNEHQNQNPNGNQNQNRNENQNQNENQNLLTIRNNAGMTPLLIAALYGKGEMVTYLDEEMNRDGWEYRENKWVCLKCVETDLFDIALSIFPKIPVTNDDYAEIQSILGVLARKPAAFDETEKSYLNSMRACFKGISHENTTNKAKRLLTQILTATEGYSKDVLYTVLRGPRGPRTTVTLTATDHSQPPNQIDPYPSRILFVAAEMGNVKFIVELIRKYPDLIWKVDRDNRSIFHVAVSRRHESIYNLLYEIGSMKDFIVVLRDTKENNMLHLAGTMVDKNQLKGVSGAAFQMQRELLWYKEVRSMIPASYHERKNKDGKTPHELFTESHKDLLFESEKWMKGTASKCMLVATLIATMVFTVAYTVPGGYNNGDNNNGNNKNWDKKNGFPVFLDFAPFIVFVVLDAISLFLSIISILVFLSILTSRYAQEDFIKSLPDKLMFGLLMLFLSIITMMIAFSVSFFVLYRHKFTIVAGSISLLALISIIAYAVLHIPLIKDMWRSRFSSSNLFKPKKPMLYHRNPTV
uniref:uncharacterized protein LOC122582530 n=1 Tax=Erigeron canadensis TaxID=72917 RepID=UPI001CB937CA|nr:uncharacterized protein LOC122582530 [Erigeron canadensis]